MVMWGIIYDCFTHITQLGHNFEPRNIDDGSGRKLHTAASTASDHVNTDVVGHGSYYAIIFAVIPYIPWQIVDKLHKTSMFFL